MKCENKNSVSLTTEAVLTVLKVCSSAAIMFILTQCQRGKESTTMFKKQLLLINQERVLSQFPNSGKSVILQ